MSAIRRISIATTRRIEAIDVTDLVASNLVADGLNWIACPHTTVALIIGEGDPEMLSDYERLAAELFAPLEPFAHKRNNNPNAAAHLLSSLAGSQVVLPVAAGKLVLGEYQRLILLELDGPKVSRTIQIAPIASSSVEI